MTSFSDDSSRLNIYERLVDTKCGQPYGNGRVLSMFEWDKNQEGGLSVHVNDVEDLISRPSSSLRIVFAPLDIPKGKDAPELPPAIFKHYSIPSNFVSERLQSVTHSYGTRSSRDGSECAWFHFLTKNITISRSDRNRQHVEINNPVPDVDKWQTHADGGQAQADYSWIRAAFFLKIEPAPKSDVERGDHVTLICFGASDALMGRFERLLSNTAWGDVLEDPYLLFDIVMDELYLQVDAVAWSLGEVFGGMEARIFNRAVNPEDAIERIHFVALHNIAKHIVHLRESCDAVQYTLQDLSRDHRRRNRMRKDPPLVALETERALKYREGAFHSTSLRLTSMEKRMRNLIQLSFNLVAQYDSRIVQVDSKLMMLIAVVTLIFLPSSTIASIFGSQFFVFTTDGSNNLQTSHQFWVFWVITIPLTVVVLICARLYFRKLKGKVLVSVQPPNGRISTWMSEPTKKEIV